MATAFDETSVDWAVDIGCDILKVASSDINDWFLLQKLAKVGKPVIVSGDDFTVRGGSADASIAGKRLQAEGLAVQDVIIDGIMKLYCKTGSAKAKTSSTETSFLSAQEAKRTVANKITYIFFIVVFYLVVLIGKFNAFSKAALLEITSNIDCM